MPPLRENPARIGRGSFCFTGLSGSISAAVGFFDAFLQHVIIKLHEFMKRLMHLGICRASLKTHRAESCEKVFRQSKQKSARIVDPMRRIFVTNDGKDSADSPCEGFLEVACNAIIQFLKKQKPG